MGNTEGTSGLEQNYLRFLSTGMADGLVLMTGHIPVAGEPPASLASLPPIVATERPAANPQISYVGVDDVAASKVATEYLISLGHRRITYISGGPADIRSDLRHSGYQRGLKESPENLRDWRVEGGTARPRAGARPSSGCSSRTTCPRPFFLLQRQHRHRRDLGAATARLQCAGRLLGARLRRHSLR
ncbi:hypothetical protein QW131_03400 [Roseibium salinum]|nr:hypothetical protein [Roseibium salinum]